MKHSAPFIFRWVFISVVIFFNTIYLQRTQREILFSKPNPSSISLSLSTEIPVFQMKTVEIMEYPPLESHKFGSVRMTEEQVDKIINIKKPMIMHMVYSNIFFDSTGSIGRSLPLQEPICKGSTSEYAINPIVHSHYDRVLEFTHVFPNNMYHFLIEGLSYIVSLPEWLLNSSRILISSKGKYVQDALSIADIPQSNILVIPPYRVAFARTLITYTSRGCGVSNPYTMLKLRSCIVKYLGLDESPPDIIGIHCRKSEKRTILNFEELLSGVQSRYPDMHFERIPDDLGLTDQFRLYNRLKLAIEMHGANLTPSLLMQRGSILCEIFGETAHTNYYVMARITGVNYICSQESSIGHFTKTTTPVDETRVYEMIDKAREWLQM